jgi:hypothetical protein
MMAEAMKHPSVTSGLALASGIKKLNASTMEEFIVSVATCAKNHPEGWFTEWSRTVNTRLDEARDHAIGVLEDRSSRGFRFL